MTGLISLRDKIQVIQSRIDVAAKKTGRSLSDVTLVAVTKGVSADKILEAKEAGISIFAENRVQEAETKILSLAAESMTWQMIGHLQTNKVKAAVSLFSLIQSVDTVRLAGMISDESLALQKNMAILLEVNVSGEEQKYGFKPEAVYGALEEISQMQGIHVEGLMGIAPLTQDLDAKRKAFKNLKSIFSVCKTLKYPNVKMSTLSMGMSDDYEIAVEEGSNMVRLGRAIFS